MTELKVVRFFYIIFFIYMYAIADITSIKFINLIPAFLFLLILFSLFSLGVKAGNVKLVRKNQSFDSWLMNQPKKIFITSGIISLVATFFVVRFYTGQTLFSVLQNLTNNVSSYAAYQEYFKQNQIGSFSLTKVPFIFMMAFVKFNMLYSIISVNLHYKKKIPLFYLVYLFIVTIAYIYIGIARGTNFEMFELIILIIYISFVRQLRVNVKKYLWIFILIFMSIIIFMNVIAIRGGNSTAYFVISRDVFVDWTSFIVTYFPVITLLLLAVYSYFGFGFYYIAVFIDKIWIVTLPSTMTYLFPFGVNFMSKENSKMAITNFLDIGTRWHPDSILLMNRIGFIGLLICCFILGYLCYFFGNKKIINSTDRILTFFIVVQMISFPLGNFIQVSSSSKIIIFMIILYKVLCFFYRKGRHYEDSNINY